MMTMREALVASRREPGRLCRPHRRQMQELFRTLMRMKKLFRYLALLMAGLALAWWLAAGANRGWTKTLVPVKKLDEVTGQVGIEYQQRLVPGLDFLAVAMLGSGILAGISLLLRNPPAKTETKL